MKNIFYLKIIILLDLNLIVSRLLAAVFVQFQDNYLLILNKGTLFSCVFINAVIMNFSNSDAKK